MFAAAFAAVMLAAAAVVLVTLGQRHSRAAQRHGDGHGERQTSHRCAPIELHRHNGPRVRRTRLNPA
jgi:hypothetical protein